MIINPNRENGVNSADRGPIMMSISPRLARSNWSYRSPWESRELITDTRSPNRV